MSSSVCFEIVAGDNADRAAKFAASELEGSFCTSDQEFAEEWPGENGRKYKVTILVEPLE
jgi:hypothetical protein